jgi:FkbM family methyltransferase
VIWGAGTIGEHVLEKLKAKKIIPLAFVDDINPDRWGKEIQGIPILSLEKAKEEYPDATYILSSSMNHKILPKVGNLKYIHYEELYYTPQNKSRVKKVFNLLEDNESKEAFLFRLEYLNKHEVAESSTDDTYFFKMEKDSVFIDGGAYDGDTIRALEKYKPRFIYAFEPDPKNFKKLVKNIGHMQNACHFPFALYNHSDYIGFNAGRNTHSSIGGLTIVYGFALDNMTTSHKITRIKFDIEGAEIKALRGAINTIRRDRPTLAICVYHRIEDLWEIPLLINKIVPDYKLYLRRYDNKAWDGVCYGIPNESN